MSLYINTKGKGKDIVFLHGWGFHGDVWESITEKLVHKYRVTCVDLPGFGRSTESTSKSLDQISAEVASHVPHNACWAGWSFGGLVALHHAIKNPLLISKLILISSTPQFTQTDDWPCAISAEFFKKFADELESNYRGIVKSFLALQAQGCSDAKEQIRQLQAQIFKHGDPAVDVMRNGLALLQHTNLRPKLATMKTPTLLISGERDRLVPPAATKIMQQTIPNVENFSIKNAGHAPFLSHPTEVSDMISAFLYE